MGMNPLEVRRRVAESMPHEVEKTGSVVSFVTDVASALKVVASVDPVQAGSGDPSPENVRPISGWTGCKITRTGKNLCNPSLFAANKISVSSGVYTFNVSGYIADLYSGQNGNNHVIPAGTPLPFLQAGTYVFSYKLTSGGAFNNLYIVDENGNRTDLIATRVEDSTYKAFKFTMPKAGFITICRGSNSNPTVFSEPQIEVGEARTAYEPYTGNTYNITFPSEAGTVYGGELTVNKDGSGTLIVDRQEMLFDGSSDEGWAIASAENNYAVYRIGPKGLAVSSQIISNLYPQGAAATNVNVINILSQNSGTNIYIHPSWQTQESTAEDIKTFLAQNNLQVVFKLATAVSYSLTPGQVKALMGVNNIWADTGNVTISNIWEH